jgi:nucleotide-binding universal stress UspA family protein
MPNTIKRILVPVDFSAASRAALWRATELAKALGASIELLHVIELPDVRPMASEGYVPVPVEYRKDVRRQAEEHLKDWLSTADVPPDVRRDVREGRPFAEIIRYARERTIDLIAMGTHGRGGMSHLLIGSVTDNVVRAAPCPVLTVRDESEPAIDVPGLD